MPWKQRALELTFLILFFLSFSHIHNTTTSSPLSLLVLSVPESLSLTELQPGVEIIGWRFNNTDTFLVSPFDWYLYLDEWAPRGAQVLVLPTKDRRTPLPIDLPHAVRLSLEPVPRFGNSPKLSPSSILDFLASESTDCNSISPILADLSRFPRRSDSFAFLLLQAALRAWKLECTAAVENLVRLASSNAITPHARQYLKLTLGRLYIAQYKTAEARDIFEQALSDASNTSLATARLNYYLADLAWLAEDLPAAESYAHVAYSQVSAIAPTSSFLGDVVFLQGNLALAQHNLVTAQDLYQSALLLHDHSQAPCKTRVDILTNLAISYSNQSDNSNATATYESALRIAQSIGTRASTQARIAHNYAVTSATSGDLHAAQEKYSLAIRLTPTSSVDAKIHLLRTLIGSISVEVALGNLQTAQQQLTQAREIANEATIPTLLLAHLSSATARFAAETGEFNKALGPSGDALETFLAYEEWTGVIQAINIALPSTLATGDRDRATDFAELLQTLLREQDLRPSLRGLALRNLGDYEARWGNYLDAERFYTEALDQFEGTPGSSLNSAAVLNNLGLMLTELGRPQESLVPLIRALRLTKQSSPEGLLATGILNHLGNSLRELGRLAEAEAMYQQAAFIRYRKTPNSPLLASLLNNIALLHEFRGDYAMALRYHNQALNIRNTHDNPIDIATSMANLGITYYSLGDYPKAELLLTQAVEIFKNANAPPPFIATTQSALGLVQEKLGSTEAAIATLQESLNLIESREYGLFSRVEQTLQLGVLSLMKGHLGHADKFLSDALAYCEQEKAGSAVRVSILANLAELRFLQNRKPEFLALAHLLLSAISQDSFSSSPAFSQNSPPWVRGEDLRQLAHRVLGTGDFKLGFRIIETLKSNRFLHRLSRRLERGPSDRLTQGHKHLRSLQDRLLLMESSATEDHALILESAQEALQMELLSSDTNVSHTRLVREETTLDSESLLENLQAALEPDELFLSYSVSNESILVLSISAHEYQHRVLSVSTGDLQQLLDTYLQSIMRARTRQELDSLYRNRSQRLVNSLFKPIIDPLQQAKKIIIAPDDFLYRIPFAALVNPLEQRRSDGALVLDDWSIIISPSATFYTEKTILRSSQHSHQDTVDLVLIGAPSPPEGSTEIAHTGEPHPTYSRLPHARREVLTIFDLYRNDSTVELFVGPEASESYMKDLPHHITTLHVASHMTADSNSPYKSALVLSESFASDSDLPENGYLQAWEIYDHFEPHAELVVLSGCSSSIGPDYDGEGPLSLTKAFLYTGASSVIASLWNVEDHSTAELMIAFHRSLRSGYSSGEALRMAQLQIRDSSHTNLAPYYWASFQIYGVGK